MIIFTSGGGETKCITAGLTPNVITPTHRRRRSGRRRSTEDRNDIVRDESTNAQSAMRLTMWSVAAAAAAADPIISDNARRRAGITLMQ